jgi:hypothetical protein
MSGRIFVVSIAIVCLTLAALGSARSAAADLLWRSGRLDALLALLPGHSNARILRSRPGDLEQAAAAPSALSKPLIDLAMSAESRGDLAAAQRHLEEAQRRDATFPPRWAAINFLMRRGENEKMLNQAASAARLYEGDLTALFDLCLRTGAGPEQVYRKIVPQRAHAQREFLELMIRRGQHAEALPAALRLADMARPRDREILFGYCDQLLANGAGSKVAQLWRTLPRFGNAEGRCLDWKANTADGISVIETGDTVIRLELSGRQPESSVVLRRPMVVQPGRHYHLRALVKGDDATRRAAVEWRWNGAAVGTGQQSDIEVEATREICDLELAIRRRPGQRAAEGPLEITNIRLELKAEALAAVR